MEDPPDADPAGDQPRWAFYSLWPRIGSEARPEPDEGAEWRRVRGEHGTHADRGIAMSRRD